MRTAFFSLLLALSVAHPAVAGKHEAMTIQLKEQNKSGQSGKATLTPEAGDSTKVEIELKNAPAGVAQPAHIHLGTCDKLDQAPKWKLEPVKDGKSVTTVPASLKTITAEKSAINVHKSADEIQTYVACGDIAKGKAKDKDMDKHDMSRDKSEMKDKPKE